MEYPNNQKIQTKKKRKTKKKTATATIFCSFVIHWKGSQGKECTLIFKE